MHRSNSRHHNTISNNLLITDVLGVILQGMLEAVLIKQLDIWSTLINWLLSKGCFCRSKHRGDNWINIKIRLLLIHKLKLGHMLCSIEISPQRTTFKNSTINKTSYLQKCQSLYCLKILNRLIAALPVYKISNIKKQRKNKWKWNLK